MEYTKEERKKEIISLLHQTVHDNGVTLLNVTCVGELSPRNQPHKSIFINKLIHQPNLWLSQRVNLYFQRIKIIQKTEMS